MTLKAMIDSDIDVVFLNFDDFAENITLDGVEMLAVAEETDPNVTQSQQQRYEGTFRRSLRLYVRALDNPPVIGRRTVLTYNNITERWTCKKLIQEGGMMKIDLEAVDS